MKQLLRLLAKATRRRRQSRCVRLQDSQQRFIMLCST
jgi:hypothetical protein